VSPSVDGSAPELNQFLASLPRGEYEAMLPDLHDVQVAHKQWISRSHEPIDYLYFPRGAVLSVLVPMQDGQSVEGATIGPEGLTGIAVFLGEPSAPDEVICQVAGPAARMTSGHFRSAVERSPALHTQLHHYTLALMGQLTRTAGCNRVHPIEERCARWLLMTADRVGANEFPLTQEFLAIMLGVRRPSVTVAAGLLQEAGLIRYRRGKITIVDRQRLEQAACEDYRLTRDIYKRLYEERSSLDQAKRTGNRKPTVRSTLTEAPSAAN
jgi:CRP-like cAMP-binding protein